MHKFSVNKARDGIFHFIISALFAYFIALLLKGRSHY